MSAAQAYRRVVTALDAAGRSCIAIDGPVRTYSHGEGGHIWRTAGIPADNAGDGDVAVDAFSYDLFHDGGSNFFVVEMAPGARSSVHATDTIDYIVMVEGEVVLALDSGEVTLRKGDFVVDRGVVHGWRNDSPARAAYAVVTVPALPVGKGRTV